MAVNGMDACNRNRHLTTSPVEVLWHAGDLLGEGPIWDHRSDSLLWIDILRGIVHRWSATRGACELIHLDMLIGCVALAGEADLLLATSGGLMRWKAASNELSPMDSPRLSEHVRFNDGRVDPVGRFWVGTMARDAARYAEPLGVLYRVDADGDVVVMEEGLTISNGLDWSADGRTFYLTDTMRRVIYAYDFDARAGTISNRRVFVSTAPEHGFPDGLTVDCDDHVWSAGFGAGCLCRYDADGRLMQTVKLPVSCPTAITFGGPGLATAFVTSSSHTLTLGSREPDAGSVLTLALKRAGRSAAVFGMGVDR